MRFLSAAIFSLVASLVSAGPLSLKSIERVEGEKLPNSYIVALKDGTDKASVITSVKNLLGPGDAVTHDDWDSRVYNGFAVQILGLDILNLVLALPGIASISEDSIVTAYTVQNGAPWGIARISQRKKLSSSDAGALIYDYNYKGTGDGVDVYVVDTGINTNHDQFEGRARWGFSITSQEIDGNGHGTHVAGTVGGKTFGVAKQVNLIAVKVLTDEGSGTSSGIISGLSFVVQAANASKKPSIATMSLGGIYNRAFNDAVTNLVKQNIHVTVAAGNSGLPAELYSPASAPDVITVGASEITDKRASYSNFGGVVDIFAPGTDIISAWIGSNTATNKISGTSMATPHVAGLAATLLSSEGSMSPSAMANRIKSLATQNALQYSLLPLTSPYLLAYNGV